MNNNQGKLAIIGVACRLPGNVNSIEELWQLLVESRDVVTEIPPERWDHRRFLHPDRRAPGRTCTFSAGVIENITDFDANFFGVSRKEAEMLDPQQRMVLEMTWEALEDAGIPPSRIAGTKTAVFIGASSMDMGAYRAGDPCFTGPYSMTGISLSIIANRISYIYDIHGPSMTIDTACSSSLVALNQACRTLSHDEFPMAIVGGVNILLNPLPFIGFSKAHMLSKDGRCKVFDASGNGYVRAEGGGIVLLKRLDHALKDGDKVYATIVASGVNSDGKTTGIALPNQEAQKSLLNSIYIQGDIDPRRLAYVEAHGTGTTVGDPIETGSIGIVLGRARQENNPLYIGSIKGNIGHLEPASGMAGLIKALLVLKHGMIPPNQNFNTPNPDIDFEGLNLRVPTEMIPLPETNGCPLIGVNSFGFGGTNAHVVLEAGPARGEVEATAVSNEEPPPLFLSAKSRKSLCALAGEYAAVLDASPDISVYGLAATAARHRDHLSQRLVVTAPSREDLSAILKSVAQISENSDASPIDLTMARMGEVAVPVGGTAFVFSSNGCQWPGMGMSLLRVDRVFTDTIRRIDEYLSNLQKWSILEEMKNDGPNHRLDHTDVAQPLLFAIQVGLFEALKVKGFVPEAVYGHSVGEVAAAYASGALSLEDACRVIHHRSALQETTYNTGSMAAVNISPEKAAEFVAAFSGKVELAGINALTSVTLAGHRKALEVISEGIKGENGFCRILNLAYPFHSSHMDCLEQPLRSALSSLRPRPSVIPFISTVTGREIAGESLDAEYWWRNIREPVLFHAATTQLLARGTRFFLEIGAHGVLQPYIKDSIRNSGEKGWVGQTLRREENDATEFHNAWRAAYVAGWKPDWNIVYSKPAQRLELPRYQWDRETLWCASTREDTGLISGRQEHPLLGCRVGAEAPLWENTLDTGMYPWLSGHVVGETVVFPAAGIIEVSLAAARDRYPDAPVLELVNLDIRRPLPLGPVPGKKLRVTVSSNGDVRIESRTILSAENWTQHAKARITKSDSTIPTGFDLEALTIAENELPVERLYDLAHGMGLDYEAPFRAVDQAWKIEDGILSHLTLTDPVAGQDMLLAPPLLDGAFQSLFFLLLNRPQMKSATAYLPSWFGKIQYFTPQKPAYGLARLHHVGPQSLVAAFDLLDDAGNVIARFSDCRFRRVSMRGVHAKDPSAYTFEMRPTPHPKEDSKANVPSPTELKVGLTQKLDELSRQLHRRNYYENILPLCQAGTLSFAYEVIRPFAQEGPFTLDNLVGLGLLKSKYIPYVTFILELLEKNGLARLDHVRWSLADQPHDLPPSVVLWRTIVADHPAHLPEALLIGRVGLHLRALLRGKVTADEIIDFKAGGNIDHYYANAPSLKLVIEAVKELVYRVMENNPQGKRLRILEVGACPGGLLVNLLPIIDPFRCDYIVTDKDVAALEELKAYWTEFKGISFMPLDIEQAEMDYPGGFDLILAGHVLNETNGIEHSLRNCANLLAPGGLLVIVERGPSNLIDMIEGVQPSWWARSASPSEPVTRLLSHHSWVEFFQKAGFEDATAIIEPCNGHDPDSFLVIGRKPVAERELSDFIAADESSLWLIFTDLNGSTGGAALSREIEQRLRKAGAETVRLEVDSALDRDLKFPLNDVELSESWEQLFAVLGTQRRIECIHLFGFETEPHPSTRTMELVQRLRVTTANAFAQAWEKVGRPEARLWLITGGCAELPGNVRQPVVSQASLWGFGRVVTNEMPGLETRLIDIHDTALSEGAFDAIVRELLQPTEEKEVVLDGNDRYCPRLCPLDSMPAAPKDLDLPDAIELTFDTPGKLDHLYWRQVPRQLPGPGEVQVEVVATGLNFRDVMWTLGMLPDEALEKGFSGPTLGLECSGVVSAVGAGVNSVRTGDEVVCFAPACFSSYVITPENAVTLKPPSLTHEEAATIPVAFFTAYYALKHLARLEPGEKVLIHGAAGGVGLAAIQIASHLGLDIIATAGSEEKRDFLRLLGVEHVLDSRSLRFADDVLKITNGKGIDAVLNSLFGDAIEKGLSILKPFGRFLELGKRDFFEDTAMYLRPFRNNISYFGIDVDHLFIEKPQLAKFLFTELLDLFYQGALRPLPHRVFPRANTVEAFRKMQQSRHIGKLVVKFDEYSLNVRPAPFLRPELPVSPEASYLITGGLGGFGLATARRLCERGARHLLLLGRNGHSSQETVDAVEDLRAGGADVRVLQADVGNMEELGATLGTALKDAPPLRGIIHAAAVLDDAVIKNQTPERYAKVLAAKALGAWNLHNFSNGIDLDFFVMYSSATTVFGNPGQANYVAANLVLETLAAYRHSLGLPGLAIGFGPLSDVGMLKRDPKTLETLKNILGVSAISSSQALDLLDKLYWKNVSSASVFSVDWRRAKQLPMAATPKFSIIMREIGNDGDVSALSPLELIKGKERGEAVKIIAELLAGEIATILRIPSSRLNMDAPMADLGMDSLMTVELGLAFEERLGLEVPMASFSDGASVRIIAERFYDVITKADNEKEVETDNQIIETMKRQHAVAGQHEVLAQRVLAEVTGEER